MNAIEEKIKTLYSDLTNKQQGVSKFIVENLEETAFLSLSKLAQKTKVSEASITRFCLALGYEGYADLQKDLQAWIKSRVTPLIKVKSISKIDKKNIYVKVIDADVANLEALREKLPETQLDQAVESIIEAEKVYVIGMRSSFAPAFLLGHYLNHIGIDCEVLDPGAGRLLDKMIYIGRNDVVIGISFPRYFKQTIEVLRYAKNNGCKTIVITDNVLSPAAQNGGLVICCKYYTPIPFLSYVSVLSVINSLIFGIITKRKNKSVSFMAAIEKMLEKWDSCLTR